MVRPLDPRRWNWVLGPLPPAVEIEAAVDPFFVPVIVFCCLLLLAELIRGLRRTPLVVVFLEQRAKLNRSLPAVLPFSSGEKRQDLEIRELNAA